MKNSIIIILLLALLILFSCKKKEIAKCDNNISYTAKNATDCKCKPGYVVDYSNYNPITDGSPPKGWQGFDCEKMYQLEENFEDYLFVYINEFINNYINNGRLFINLPKYGGYNILPPGYYSKEGIIHVNDINTGMEEVKNVNDATVVCRSYWFIDENMPDSVFMDLSELGEYGGYSSEGNSLYISFTQKNNTSTGITNFDNFELHYRAIGDNNHLSFNSVKSVPIENLNLK